MTRFAFLLVLAAVACSGERDPAPEPLDLSTTQGPAAGSAPERAPTPEEQARAIAGDPRMLLFDLQTALTGVHETAGAYPTTAEFQVDDRWGLQRAALDAAFSSWEYASDGATYRLTGVAGGRRFDIASPSS
jgi:hypothetical protein